MISRFAVGRSSEGAKRRRYAGLPQISTSPSVASTLVVHRNRAPPFEFGEVEFGDDAKRVGREFQRAHVDARLHDSIGGRRLTGSLVDPPMRMPAFHRVRRFGPFALHPFEIGQAGAIRVFVDHARGQVWGAGREGRCVEGEVGLMRRGPGHFMRQQIVHRLIRNVVGHVTNRAPPAIWPTIAYLIDDRGLPWTM